MSRTPQRIVLAARGSLIALLAGPGSAGGALGFVERAADWGIDFVHRHGGSGERYMVQTVVVSVLLFDYDADGGVLPGYEGPAPASRLFRNDGPGRFVDVTGPVRLAGPAYGAGGAADVDEEGDLDLSLMSTGPTAKPYRSQLYRNDGDGTPSPTSPARPADLELRGAEGALQSLTRSAVARRAGGGRDPEARAHLEESVALVEEALPLEHLLARLLATAGDAAVRNGARALELAEAVFRRAQSPEHAETVAMALAELGRFEEAGRWQQGIIDRAMVAGEGGRAAGLRARKAAYERGEPVRTPWLGGSR